MHVCPLYGPVASSLVIAPPKATAPFIRFCGDYQGVNKFIPHWHIPIPHPQRTISDKLVNHDAYGDVVDMTNGFHQLPIDEDTSMKLSIQTPWGRVCPLFLPEGVSIGNAHLQQSEILKDCEWAIIVIFDNILICASDYDELYERIDIALVLCIKYNVTLKMGKTWLGFQEVKFFGYVCRKGSYELVAERKVALNQISFPTSTKGMQSFLGFALFFKPSFTQ